MNANQLGERAAEILAACSTMTLATSGADATWEADVFFASEGLTEHFFISSPNSRHARNLIELGGAAATVHPDPGTDWRAIIGVQMEGSAAAIAGGEIERARSIYLAKFPFAAALLRPESEIAAKTAATQFFVLRAQHLCLVDNSLGFGNRHEIALEGSR